MLQGREIGRGEQAQLSSTDAGFLGDRPRTGVDKSDRAPGLRDAGIKMTFQVTGMPAATFRALRPAGDAGNELPVYQARLP